MKDLTERTEGFKANPLRLGIYGIVTAYILSSGSLFRQYKPEEETAKGAVDSLERERYDSLYSKTVQCIDQGNTGMNPDELATFLRLTGTPYQIKMWEDSSNASKKAPRITFSAELPTIYQMGSALGACRKDLQGRIIPSLQMIEKVFGE